MTRLLGLLLLLSLNVLGEEAYYRHHQRNTTTSLEADLVNREIGIDGSSRNCFVGKNASGVALHGLCKESDTASLSGVLNVTGQANFSAAIKASNYNSGSIPFFGTGGLLSEDGTNFTFDNTNDRLAVKKITAADSVILTAGTASTPLYLNAGKVITSGSFTGTGSTFALSASPSFTGTASLANLTVSGTATTTGVHTFTAAPVFSSATASQFLLLDGSKAITSVAGTGSGSVLRAVSPTTTGTLTADAITASGNLTLSGLSSGRIPYFSTGGLISQDNFYWDSGNDRLGVGSGASSPLHSIQTSKSAAGGLNTIAVYNTDNTNGASGAVFYAETGGASSGDPAVQFNNGVSEWKAGLDNSDGDAFVISESGTLGTSNRLKLAAGGAAFIPGTLSLGGNEAFTYDEGTFTATYVGGTTSPTGTASWVRVGKQVTLVLPSLSATSNSTSFSYSGLDASLVPVTNQSMPLPPGSATDNGTTINTVRVYIDQSGPTIRFQVNGLSSGWTGSGTKGLSGGTSANVVVTYTLY